MRHFAITGIDTVSWISLIMPGSDMRATPPWTRMSAGTRSSAITATAPASSAMRACSALTTSMITPPLSISARPVLTRRVPVSFTGTMLPGGVGPLDKESLEIHQQRFWVAVQLAPRDADDAVAGRLEGAIASSVLLEGMRSGVRLAAVELDNEAAGGPQAVGVDGAAAYLQGRVEQRHREAVLLQEAAEAALEL